MGTCFFLSVCGWVDGYMSVSVCGLVGGYVCVSMWVVDVAWLVGTFLCQCVGG